MADHPQSYRAQRPDRVRAGNRTKHDEVGVQFLGHRNDDSRGRADIDPDVHVGPWAGSQALDASGHGVGGQAHERGQMVEGPLRQLGEENVASGGFGNRMDEGDGGVVPLGPRIRFHDGAVATFPQVGGADDDSGSIHGDPFAFSLSHISLRAN
jgi:hypothetical protein